MKNTAGVLASFILVIVFLWISPLVNSSLLSKPHISGSIPSTDLSTESFSGSHSQPHITQFGRSSILELSLPEQPYLEEEQNIYSESRIAHENTLMEFTPSNFHPDANILINGDFEVPINSSAVVTWSAGQSFEGWTVESGTVDQVASWQDASGNQSMDLAGTPGPGAIYQEVQTIAGQTYLLRFAMAGNPDGDPPIKQMVVKWEGETLDTLSFDTTGNDVSNLGWGYHSYSVVATSAMSRLQFESLTSGVSGPTLDDVRIEKVDRFLVLPFSYSRYSAQALMNWHIDGGRVTSWLDHDLPTEPVTLGNGEITLFNGAEINNFPTVVDNKLTCYGYKIEVDNRSEPLYCYDDHNGYDFKKGDSLDIRAAAGGVVKQASCGGYGNQVVIDHQNQYYTLYGHLADTDVNITTGITITQGTKLGTMGGTGSSCDKEFGVHLHFGVYRDNGDGVWTGTADEIVVDPNGWMGSTSDPWVSLGGTTSFLLWEFDLFERMQFDGTLGASIADPGGAIQAEIPAGYFSGWPIVDLFQEPAIVPSSPSLFSIGRSFWLRRVGQQVGGNSISSSRQLTETEFIDATSPITITVAYSDTAMLHLDESQISLFHWDEELSVWEPITTTLDNDTNLVIGQSMTVGHFDLQAPLVCPADQYITDDSFYGAVSVPVDGSQASRLFDVSEDEDWFSFQAVAGASYTIQTEGLSSGVDTALELYDIDGLTLLGSDDNGGSLASHIIWQPQQSGTYFIRALPYAGSSTGCGSTYQVSVSELQAPKTISLNDPSTGLINSSYSFTATVAPISATQPLMYEWQASNQNPITNTTGITETVGYTWSTSGQKNISVSVSNDAGMVTGTHAIIIFIPSVADFEGSPTRGIAPLSVEFSNLSDGDFDNCHWNFGDSHTSSDCGNPSHNYTIGGFYTVSLMISGPGGTHKLTKANYIEVNEPVVANFTASPTSGLPPLMTTFKNLSSGDFENCFWDLGDGSNSTDCDLPNHTYAKSGIYTITLMVNGPGGTDTIIRAEYINTRYYIVFMPVFLKPE